MLLGVNIMFLYAGCNYSLNLSNILRGQNQRKPNLVHIISLHLPYIHNIKYIIFYYFTIAPP